jgi:hypothetical protein
MSGEEIAVILGAMSALIATTIYAMKNVRESSCSLSGCKCNQDTRNDPQVSEI